MDWTSSVHKTFRKVSNFGSGSVWLVKMVIAIRCWNCVITPNGEKTPLRRYLWSSCPSLPFIEQIFADSRFFSFACCDLKSTKGKNPRNVRSAIGAFKFYDGFGVDRGSDDLSV